MGLSTPNLPHPQEKSNMTNRGRIWLTIDTEGEEVFSLQIEVPLHLAMDIALSVLKETTKPRLLPTENPAYLVI